MDDLRTAHSNCCSHFVAKINLKLLNTQHWITTYKRLPSTLTQRVAPLYGAASFFSLHGRPVDCMDCMCGFAVAS